MTAGDKSISMQFLSIFLCSVNLCVSSSIFIFNLKKKKILFLYLTLLNLVETLEIPGRTGDESISMQFLSILLCSINLCLFSSIFIINVYIKILFFYLILLKIDQKYLVQIVMKVLVCDSLVFFYVVSTCVLSSPIFILKFYIKILFLYLTLLNLVHKLEIPGATGDESTGMQFLSIFLCSINLCLTSSIFILKSCFSV